MQKDFDWLVSELVRQTRDSEVEARHTIETLREIARFEAGAVADILGLADLESRHIVPPLGVCLPCEWASCPTAHTVQVRLRAGQNVVVELIGCHVPNVAVKEGLESLHFLMSLFERDGRLRACFPLADDEDTEALVRVLRPLAYETIAGCIYIGTENVSEIMVQHGFATKERQDA